MGFMDAHLNQVNGGANKVVQLYIADSESLIELAHAQ